MSDDGRPLEESALGLLVDGRLLRRLLRTVRFDVAEFAVDPGRDPDLLAISEEPFASSADARNRLERLEAALLDRSDRRSVFLTVYTEMTTQTLSAMAAAEFSDAAWMERYLVRFAEYYRRAFYDFERGALEEVPDPWIVAFGTAVRGESLVLQDALLGINAHINYDLALTLSDVGLDPDRPAKYADHNRVNDLLARLVSVQRELLSERYAPGLSRVGVGLGGLDERGSAAALRTAREAAWRTAVVRSDTRWESVRTYTEWLLRRTATGAASLLVHPDLSPSAMEVLHDVEGDSVDLVRYAREYHERANRTA